MRAFSLTIPSNWISSGAVFAGSSCNEGPFPVVRLSSPEGLTAIQKSARPEQPHPDCLQYDREMLASGILKYMVGVLQVGSANANHRGASDWCDYNWTLQQNVR